MLIKKQPKLKRGDVVQNQSGKTFVLDQDSYKIRFFQKNKAFISTQDEYVRINGYVVNANDLTKVKE